jgi:hypothetical protein
VQAYWPRLDPEPPSAEGVAQRLYDVRNSLAHDLGVKNNPGQVEHHEIKRAAAADLSRKAIR